MSSETTSYLYAGLSAEEEKILRSWIADDVFTAVLDVAWWNEAKTDFYIFYPAFKKRHPVSFDQVRQKTYRLPKWINRCQSEEDFFQAVGRLMQESGQMRNRGSWDSFLSCAREQIT